MARLESPPGGWELVVVDNGSADNTPEVIGAFMREAAFPVIQARERQPGVGRARNTGIAHAQGELYVFTDDDCYVRPDFLWQVCCVFERPNVGYVGGRVVRHDPTDDPVTTKDVLTPEIIPPRSFLPAGVIHGANMAVRREVIQGIGGFDPLLGAGTPFRCGEDIDLLARACWAGWVGTYDPRPVVAHHHGRKPGREVQRLMRGYDYGRGAYYAKALLDGSRRRVYLGRWGQALRHDLRSGLLGRPTREIAGAAHYLAYSLIDAICSWPRPRRSA